MTCGGACRQTVKCVLFGTTARGRSDQPHWTWRWSPGGPVERECGGWRAGPRSILYTRCLRVSSGLGRMCKWSSAGESAERRLAGDHDRNGIGRIAAFPGFWTHPLGWPNLYKSAMTLRVRLAPLVLPLSPGQRRSFLVRRYPGVWLGVSIQEGETQT